MTDETTKIQINMAKLQSDVEHIRDSLDDHIQQGIKHREEVKKIINEFKITADKRYSGKWLEKFVVRVGWIVLGVVVPSMLYLVYSVFEHVQSG